MTKEQRDELAKHVAGKTVSSLSFDEEGGYWVMGFGDGGELCFRTMAEIVEYRSQRKQAREWMKR